MWQRGREVVVPVRRGIAVNARLQLALWRKARQRSPEWGFYFGMYIVAVFVVCMAVGK